MNLFRVFAVRCWLVFVALSFLPIIFQGRSLHIFTRCPPFDSSLPLFIMLLPILVFVFLKMKGFWVFCLSIKRKGQVFQKKSLTKTWNCSWLLELSTYALKTHLNNSHQRFSRVLECSYLRVRPFVQRWPSV